MLTTEMVFNMTKYKCEQHNVSFDYCYSRISQIEHVDGFSLYEEIDKLMAWAYFNDFYALYAGIIPYRECTDDIIDDAPDLN